MNLTILTLNLQLTRPGQTRRERVRLIADFLKSEPELPTVICLQEAWGGVIAGDAFFELCDLMPEYQHVSASCSQWLLRPFFQARVGIMSLCPIVDWDYKYLNSKTSSWNEWLLWHKRPMVKATIEYDKTFYHTYRKIDIYSVHLSGQDDDDIEKVLGYAGIYRIIAGDFNFGPNSAGYKRLTIQRQGVGHGPDYIFYGDYAKLEECSTMFEGLNGRVVSDHMGVWARFEV